MANYVLDIGSNDDLSTVIKKCNTNFKSVLTQISTQAQNSSDEVYGDIGDAIDGLLQVIDQEAGIRKQKDKDLENELETLRSSVSSVYRYKGSVNTGADLPSAAEVGDVYNIETESAYGTAGMNVAWTGSRWDALGGIAASSSGGGSGGGSSDACPFPIGYVMQMTSETDPNTIYPDTIWRMISGVFLLSSSDSHALGSTGGSESVTLTAGQSGVPAHKHGHTIQATTPTLSHSVVQPEFTLPSHTHAFTQPTVADHAAKDVSGGAHTHTTRYYNSSGTVSASYYPNTTKGKGKTATDIIASSGSHTHTVSKYTHSVSGGSVGSPSTTPDCVRKTDVSIGDHDGADCVMTGSVSDSAPAGAVEPHDNMPPYRVVNMWERVA